MIGASIFSIFGLGAQIAGKNLPEAFVLSGLFALIVAYSYAKLGGKIVSNAGPIEYILHGIGDSVIAGSLSILLWLSYVVSIALFAKGFSGYFLPLFHLGTTPLAMGITEVGLIAFFTFLSYLGSSTVGKTEVYIVAVKLLILGVFIVLGFLTINLGSVKPSASSPAVHGTLSAAVIFFLSYMGFGLVTNTSENMKDPRKTVPKAIFISIAVVMVVYIAVSLAAIGNLSIAALVQAKDNALAEAARPFLGNGDAVQVSQGGGREPAWSPGGERIYYRASAALMAAEVSWEGLAKGVLVLGVLWWAWVGYAWLTSVVDPEEGAVRIACIASILGNLLIAVSPWFIGVALGRVLAGVCLGLALVLGPVLARSSGDVRLIGMFGGSVTLGTAAALGIGAGMRAAGIAWRLDFALAAARAAHMDRTHLRDLLRKYQLEKK